MSSHIQKLYKQNLLSCPPWLPASSQYEVMMGSTAYGVSNDTSDIDIYGFCIPHKDVIFPHLKGEIVGFGRQKNTFEQYQEHHITSIDNKKEYDISIYNIVKYFMLCMENNPNMIDSLFVPARCILHITNVASMMRDERNIFLHKGGWHKFKGYSYAQVHKMSTQNPEGKRKEIVTKYGYDLKFAYHVVRLLNEIEQILLEGTLDLDRNSEQLKSIRRGEWSEQQILDYFTHKEKELEKLYIESKLPHAPDEHKIKCLLLNCLEEYYGSLQNCVVNPDKAIQVLREVNTIIQKSNLI